MTFTYREELTHDDYHVPLIVSALDPANLVGAPLGDIGVTAFASLSISDGDRILGDYTAKEHVSKSYNLYSHPTHKEVDDAARAAVRATGSIKSSIAMRPGWRRPSPSRANLQLLPLGQ